MSALPPKADIGTQSWNIRFVPKADIGRPIFGKIEVQRVPPVSCCLWFRSHITTGLNFGCTGAVWALLPSTTRADKPSRFFRQFSAESAPQIRYYAESAAVMCGVCKMCTIQTSRRAPIARQTQISKTAPMNPAIR